MPNTNEYVHNLIKELDKCVTYQDFKDAKETLKKIEVIINKLEKDIQ